MLKYKYHFLAFVCGFLACFGLLSLSDAKRQRKALDDAHPWHEVNSN